MSDHPLVTIGISTYNRAEGYLREALLSALAQTYPNLEVVVSDNASTDGTADYLATIDDPRLRVLRQPRNLGANGNFNACLDAARGKWFLLLHDDDRLDPQMVSRCLAAADHRTDLGLIRCGVRIVDGRGSTKKSRPNRAAQGGTAELFRAWSEGRAHFYFCNTLFRTDRLRELGGFGTREDLFQDVAAIARMAGLGRVEVPEVLASFRRHDDNKGASEAALAWTEDALYLLDVLEVELGRHDDPAVAEEVLAGVRRFLCRKCYRIVARVDDPEERSRLYAEVYRRFGRSYSPVRYRLDRYAKALRRRLAGGGGGARVGVAVPR